VAALVGDPATVLIGFVQGAAMPAALPAEVAALRRAGALVGLVLVPLPGASPGPGGFGAWVTATVAALPASQFVAVVAPAAPSADSAPEAADVVAGVSAASRAAPGQPVGVWWGDGGTSPADMVVWSALGASSALSGLGFVAASFTGAAACTGPGALAAAVSGVHPAGGVGVLAEGVASDPAASPQCLAGAASRAPSSAALWRVGAGPVFVP
jgi:hypothetical protein